MVAMVVGMYDGSKSYILHKNKQNLRQSCKCLCICIIYHGTYEN